MKVPLLTFASRENQLIAAMIIYLGQRRSRVIAPTYPTVTGLSASTRTSTNGQSAW